MPMVCFLFLRLVLVKGALVPQRYIIKVITYAFLFGYESNDKCIMNQLLQAFTHISA